MLGLRSEGRVRFLTVKRLELRLTEVDWSSYEEMKRFSLIPLFTVLFLNVIQLDAFELHSQWKLMVKDACKKYDLIVGSAPYCIFEGRQVFTSTKNLPNFFCPRLMFWDPLNEVGKKSRWPLLCPSHYKPLTPTDNWMNGTSNSRNHRIVWDGNGPLLLVAREYSCLGNDNRPAHYMRTTDSRLLGLIEENRQEILFSQTFCYLKSFLMTINDFVLSGMSFNQMNLLLHQRVQDFIATAVLKIEADQEDGYLDIAETDSEIIETLSERMVSIVPDDETLKGTFNEWYKLNKETYDNAMASKNDTALMADHTFKVKLSLYFCYAFVMHNNRFTMRFITLHVLYARGITLFEKACEVSVKAEGYSRYFH